MPLKPKVVLVGGPDVDARLDLMCALRSAVDVGALGSRPALRERFVAEGFGYQAYRLTRQVNPISDLVTLGQLISIFRRLQPDIVHTFDTKPGVWGCVAARLAGVPVVITTLTGLGSLYTSERLAVRSVRAVYQTLQELASRVADLTIFQNHDDAQQFIAQGVVPAHKAIVIAGSGVRTDEFAPVRVSAADKARVRSELGVGSDEVVVTMISRVIRSKGVLEFAAAAPETRRAGARARFLLIGPEDPDSVDRLSVSELDNLRQTVTWLGPRRDISAVLAISDVFVLPSVYREGIPRVLLEAASMGLPLVTTDSPGCNDVVEDGVNGFLVPAHDAAALSRTIVHLADEPELRRRFGHASRQRAVERFDLAVIAGQTHSAYQHLLARKALLQADEA